MFRNLSQKENDINSYMIAERLLALPRNIKHAHTLRFDLKWMKLRTFQYCIIQNKENTFSVNKIIQFKTYFSTFEKRNIP